MSETFPVKIIARIHTDFPTKFGVPRQSGLIDSLESLIIFEPEYRDPLSLRGLEEFSHLWLIWQFSKAVRDTWSPTVRPPKLGGNQRIGVFATRSPFRPNAIGLSSVRLLGVEKHPRFGHILRVAGADLMDGTPIYDIKPYLPYADCHPDATGGFAAAHEHDGLEVVFPAELEEAIAPEHRQALRGVLAHDPRPSYQSDPERVYGVAFAGKNVRFTVKDGVLTVCAVEKLG